jgi:hypothetical protein
MKCLPCVLAAWFLGSLCSHALLLYDSNSNGNAFNVIDPGLTNSNPANSLWNNIVQIRQSDGVTPDASGVYLGNGYLLTANHVTGTRYFLGGTEYLVDTSYGTNGIRIVQNSNNQNLDLKVIKILNPPAGLTGIPLVDSNDGVGLQVSYVMGWGVGKGTPMDADPATRGWMWGTSATAAQRWGLNVTFPSPTTFVNNPNTYLATSFNPNLFVDPNANNFVAQPTLGDSGGALFQYHDGIYKLAGLTAAVSVLGSGYYARGAGNTPDQAYYVSMAAHGAEVIDVIPEPGLGVASAVGLVFLLLSHRRRSPMF